MALYCAFIQEVERYLDSSTRLFREVLLGQEHQPGDAALLPPHVAAGQALQDEKAGSLLDAIRVGPGRGVSLRDTISQLFNNYMEVVMRDVLKYVGKSRERAHALRQYEIQTDFEKRLADRLVAEKPRLLLEREKEHARKCRDFHTQLCHLRLICDELESRLAEETASKTATPATKPAAQPSGPERAGGSSPAPLGKPRPPPPLWRQAALFTPAAKGGNPAAAAAVLAAPGAEAPQPPPPEGPLWFAACAADGVDALFSEPQLASHAPWVINTLNHCASECARQFEAVAYYPYAGCAFLVAFQAPHLAADWAHELHLKLGQGSWPEALQRHPLFSKERAGADGDAPQPAPAAAAPLAGAVAKRPSRIAPRAVAGPRLRCALHYVTSAPFAAAYEGGPGSHYGVEVSRAIAIAAAARPGETLASAAAAGGMRGAPRCFRKWALKRLSLCTPLRGQPTAECVYQVSAAEVVSRHPVVQQTPEQLHAADLFCSQWAVALNGPFHCPPNTLPPTGMGALLCVQAPDAGKAADAGLPAAALGDALAVLLAHVRESVVRYGGVELIEPAVCRAEGCFRARFAFSGPVQAAAAALAAQEALPKAAWPDEVAGCAALQPALQQRGVYPGIGIQSGMLTYELRAGGAATTRAASAALHSVSAADSPVCVLCASGSTAQQADTVAGVARPGETVVTKKVFEALNKTEHLSSHLGMPSFRVFAPQSDAALLQEEAALFSMVPAALSSKQEQWRPDGTAPPPPDGPEGPGGAGRRLDAAVAQLSAPAPAAAPQAQQRVNGDFVLAVSPYGMRGVEELDPQLHARAVGLFATQVAEAAAAAGGKLMAGDPRSGGFLFSFRDGVEALRCGMSLQLRLLSAPWEDRALHFPQTKEVSATPPPAGAGTRKQEPVLLYRGVRARIGLDCSDDDSGDVTSASAGAAALCDAAHGGEVRLSSDARRRLYGDLSRMKDVAVDRAPDLVPPLPGCDPLPAHYRALPMQLQMRAIVGAQEAAAEGPRISAPGRVSEAATMTAQSEGQVRELLAAMDRANAPAPARPRDPDGSEAQRAAEQELGQAEKRLNAAAQQPQSVARVPPPPNDMPAPYTVGASGLPYAAHAPGVRQTDPISASIAAADDAKVKRRRQLLGEWLASVAEKEDAELKTRKETKKERQAAADQEAAQPLRRPEFRAARLAFELAVRDDPQASMKSSTGQGPAAVSVAAYLSEVGIPPPAAFLREPQRRVAFDDVIVAAWPQAARDAARWWSDRYGPPGRWGVPEEAVVLAPAVAPPQPQLPSPPAAVSPVLLPMDTVGDLAVATSPEAPPVPVLAQAPGNAAPPPPDDCGLTSPPAARPLQRRVSILSNDTQPLEAREETHPRSVEVDTETSRDSDAGKNALRETRMARRRFQEDKQAKIREEEEARQREIDAEKRRAAAAEEERNRQRKEREERLQQEQQREVERQAEERRKRREIQAQRLEKERRAQARREAAELQKQAQRAMAQQHRAIRVLHRLLAAYLPALPARPDGGKDAGTSSSSSDSLRQLPPVSDDVLVREWVSTADALSSGVAVDEAALEQPIEFSTLPAEPGEAVTANQRLTMMSQMVSGGIAVNEQGGAIPLEDLSRSMVAVMCRLVNVVREGRLHAERDKEAVVRSLEEEKATVLRLRDELLQSEQRAEKALAAAASASSQQGSPRRGSAAAPRRNSSLRIRAAARRVSRGAKEGDAASAEPTSPTQGLGGRVVSFTGGGPLGPELPEGESSTLTDSILQRRSGPHQEGDTTAGDGSPSGSPCVRLQLPDGTSSGPPQAPTPLSPLSMVYSPHGSPQPGDSPPPVPLPLPEGARRASLLRNAQRRAADGGAEPSQEGREDTEAQPGTHAQTAAADELAGRIRELEARLHIQAERTEQQDREVELLRRATASAARGEERARRKSQALGDVLQAVQARASNLERDLAAARRSVTTGVLPGTSPGNTPVEGALAPTRSPGQAMLSPGADTTQGISAEAPSPPGKTPRKRASTVAGRRGSVGVGRRASVQADPGCAQQLRAHAERLRIQLEDREDKWQRVFRQQREWYEAKIEQQGRQGRGVRAASTAGAGAEIAAAWQARWQEAAAAVAAAVASRSLEQLLHALRSHGLDPAAEVDEAGQWPTGSGSEDPFARTVPQASAAGAPESSAARTRHSRRISRALPIAQGPMPPGTADDSLRREAAALRGAVAVRDAELQRAANREQEMRIAAVQRASQHADDTAAAVRRASRAARASGAGRVSVALIGGAVEKRDASTQTPGPPLRQPERPRSGGTAGPRSPQHGMDSRLKCLLPPTTSVAMWRMPAPEADAAGPAAVLPQYAGRPASAPCGVLPYRAAALQLTGLKDWWDEQARRLAHPASPREAKPVIGGDAAGTPLLASYTNVAGKQINRVPRKAPPPAGVYTVHAGEWVVPKAPTVSAAGQRRSPSPVPPDGSPTALGVSFDSSVMQRGARARTLTPPPGVTPPKPRTLEALLVEQLLGVCGSQMPPGTQPTGAASPSKQPAPSGRAQLTPLQRLQRDRGRLQRVLDAIYQANVAGVSERYNSAAVFAYSSGLAPAPRSISPPVPPGSATPLGVLRPMRPAVSDPQSTARPLSAPVPATSASSALPGHHPDKWSAEAFSPVTLPTVSAPGGRAALGAASPTGDTASSTITASPERSAVEVGSDQSPRVHHPSPVAAVLGTPAAAAGSAPGGATEVRSEAVRDAPEPQQEAAAASSKKVSSAGRRQSASRTSASTRSSAGTTKVPRPAAAAASAGGSSAGQASLLGPGAAP